VGFFALDMLGERAYLDQLSVRMDHGRRGVGKALIEAACERFRARGAAEIWLTTYAHVPWNGPFYERCGFHVVPEAQCSVELRTVLEEQRGALPAPTQRVAMVRPLGA
jgi:GNAT superfamily N-acetyltransferase